MHRTTCSKTFADFPFAHRQHNHDGHCALIHGHNWSFRLTFEADTLDQNEFVVDFGKLKWIKAWLEENFDHTLVLNESDPCLAYLRRVLLPKFGPDAERNKELPDSEEPFAKIVVVSNCGAEGLARWVLEALNGFFSSGRYAVGTSSFPLPAEWLVRNVCVRAVEVAEDGRNSARVEADNDYLKKIKKGRTV